LPNNCSAEPAAELWRVHVGQAEREKLSIIIRNAAVQKDISVAREKQSKKIGLKRLWFSRP
jgi:hypothetical protein